MRPTLLTLVFALGFGFAVAAPAPTDPWSREALTAWCIVPFDAAQRGPEARAVMLEKLNLRRFAYDWRAEHVPTFDAEVDAMRRHGIDLVAWWFPSQLDASARAILDVLVRQRIRPQLWIVGGGAPAPTNAGGQAARVTQEATRLRPVIDAAAKLGCTIGLYNHGGWFGEPENQLAIIAELKRTGVTNVGMVYNFHHGHDQMDRFAEFWSKIQAHVLAVNLNGMIAGGDKVGKKIHPLGDGDRELGLMRIIQASGWRGHVGLLNHRTEVDAEAGLARNLAGFEKLVAQLRGK